MDGTDRKREKSDLDGARSDGLTHALVFFLISTIPGTDLRGFALILPVEIRDRDRDMM